MIRSINPPLVAKDGLKLRVLAVCRISTINQDEKSLDDQEASYRKWLDANTDLPYELIVISSQGSGECIDRDSYTQAIDLVESGQFDLVISEDLGRICRRVHAHIFCETCEDAETRLIALNDNVDTGCEGWQLNSFFAAIKHESYNRDTSKRIRRTLRNRFSQGGVFQCEIYGYVKPRGAKGEEDVHKDPLAEPVYEQWFQMLEQEASYEEVADWLNEQAVPTGPYCRSDRWTGKMVKRVTFNPILKGVRQRNVKMSRRVNKTGRRRSMDAPPEDLLERECAHLAFVEPARYDRLIRSLIKKNELYRRGGSSGVDSRRNVPKKRTRWPGQSIQCGVCGRLYVYGGHGRTDHLMCSGAREHKCWNGITFDGHIACRRLSEAMFDQLATLPEFDVTFLAELQAALSQLDGDRVQRRRGVESAIQRLERESSNLVQALREMKGSPLILVELQEMEGKMAELKAELSELNRSEKPKHVLPSVKEIRRVARETFTGLALDSQEFARHMRQIATPIFVYPYRLCDGGHVVLRAEVTFSAMPFVNQQLPPIPDLAEQLTRVVVVDLFEPPQREAVREDLVRLMQANGKPLTEREIAAQLGITQPAVQNAKKLAREMERAGLTDPYVATKFPPTDYGKLRRHLHKRYRFEPVDGFPRRWPT